MRILYVEDEQFLAEAVIHMLKKENITVDHAADGETGLDLALKNTYDAMVLDIMLPKMSGLDILESVRKHGINTPIIMLSALGEVEDKVRGLEHGADDYLAKPFKTKELIARINAVCRRPQTIEDKVMTFGDLTFDINNRTINGTELTDKEAGIFEILAKNSGSAVSKQQILAYVWGNDSDAEENYVEVYISYLRKKIKDSGSSVKIKVIRNLGYKLIEGDDEEEGEN